MFLWHYIGMENENSKCWNP